MSKSTNIGIIDLKTKLNCVDIESFFLSFCLFASVAFLHRLLGCGWQFLIKFITLDINTYITNFKTYLKMNFVLHNITFTLITTLVLLFIFWFYKNPVLFTSSWCANVLKFSHETINKSLTGIIQSIWNHEDH